MDLSAKFKGTAALHLEYKAFRQHLLVAVRGDDLLRLNHLLENSSSQQMLLMRESPSLFGTSLRQHYVFDGFSFFEPNSLTLLVQLLDEAVLNGSHKSFECLWALSARLQRKGHVQFLSHFFTSNNIGCVVENPDKPAYTVLLNALVSLSPDQQNELRSHQKLHRHEMFEHMMNQAQKERLLIHTPSDFDQVSGARKL